MSTFISRKIFTLLKLKIIPIILFPVDFKINYISFEV